MRSRSLLSFIRFLFSPLHNARPRRRPHYLRLRPLAAVPVILTALATATYYFFGSQLPANLLAPAQRKASSSVSITDAPYAPAPGKSALPRNAVPVRVIKVHDGDTIRVRVLDARPPRNSQGFDAPISQAEIARLRKGQLSIRLASIDAPEISQPQGILSRDILASELEGQPVYISIQETDRYGREVAVVYRQDGTNINRLMVEKGLAWHYQTYSTDKAAMNALEQQARTGHRGVWAEAYPDPPWEYRKRNRIGGR